MTLLEEAHSIVDRFSERQLKGFVGLFREPQFIKITDEEKDREEAFTYLQNLRRNNPDLDDKKELEEYRDRRFTPD